MKQFSYFIIFTIFVSCLEPVPVEEEPTGELDSSSDEQTESVTPDTSSNSSSSSSGTDPLLNYQWHLDNDGSRGGIAGEDLNIDSLFAAGNLGSGVTVAVVDDGLEIQHPDLVANTVQSLSYNYLTGSNDPTPSSDFGHGTACAGIIGARDSNNEGLRGVSPRSNLVGYNLIAGYQSTRALDAMTRNKNIVDVSSNSWGPSDDLGEFFDPDPIWLAGVEDGISTGRSGKGIVYVWAAGNGGRTVDMSSYDGYASREGVMAVAAIGNRGRFADYSEPGSNLWIAAPSMGDNDIGIATTDLVGSSRGYNTTSGVDLNNRDYTVTFNGTSAATPMVSGVAALILEENPNLSYRDVKGIIAKTARKNDPTNSNWDTTSSGNEYNYNYGFGAVDAAAAVAAARTWTNYPTQRIENWPLASTMAVNSALADGGSEVSSDIVVSGSSMNRIEFVEVEVNLTHNDWGNLNIILERNGATTTTSILAVSHPCLDFSTSPVSLVDCTKSNNTYTFGVAKHFEEDPDATWTLKVTDAESDGESGTLNSWRIKFYGH